MISNHTIESITKRRSIRSYKPEQISEEELNTLLEAGRYAPSAANQQPWHFTVLQNKDIMQKIKQDLKEHFKSSGSVRFQQLASDEIFNPFHNAPTAIIVSGSEKALMPQADCAAALQNMLIAAEAIGLGSCWVNIVIHLFNGEKGDFWGSELGIPVGYKPMYSATFGYKALTNMPAPPRKEGCINFVR